jgi:hypothetical protein
LPIILKKKNFSLSLKNPCQQDWDSMPRENGGLYCGDCKKVVHDFSILSDQELIQLFTKKSSGNICGKFRVDQLNRNFVPQPEKQFSFRPVKILLLSLFTLKFISAANASPKFVQSANYAEQKNANPKTTPKIKNSISGKTINTLTGLPIPNITVSLVGHSITTTSDSSGNFQILVPDSIKDEKFTLHIATTNYWVADTTILKTQLPFVTTIHLTEVVQVVSSIPRHAVQEPIHVLGGVPIPEYDPIVTYKHPFWHRLRMKFRRKSNY